MKKLPTTEQAITFLGDVIFLFGLIGLPMWFFGYINLNNILAGSFNDTKTWYQIIWNIVKIVLLVAGYLLLAYIVRFIFKSIWARIVKGFNDLKKWSNKDLTNDAHKKDQVVKNNNEEKAQNHGVDL